MTIHKIKLFQGKSAEVAYNGDSQKQGYAEKWQVWDLAVKFGTVAACAEKFGEPI
ncbi:hypothetical protein [Ruminococcus albus]|uniref:hypothetical protein n=1 Tax=Ruminococcus albus TaxID=1264 RepID=UPI001FA82CD9|nr:hypothetical protein [Ruminococcus albus]